MGDHIRALKAGTVPLKLVEEARRHNAAQPPVPALPEGPTIDLNGQGEVISNALAAVAAPPMRLPPGQQRHPTTGALFSISSPEENGPNDAQTPFDLMKALLANPDKKEKPNPPPSDFGFVKPLTSSTNDRSSHDRPK